MRGLQSMLGLVIAAGALFSPLIHADAAPPPPFYALTRVNASLASSLEAAIGNFLSKTELQSMSFAMYMDGVSNPTQSRVKDHITTYCSANSPAEKASFGCSVAGENGIIAPQELGDVKASVLLDSNTLSGDNTSIAQAYIKMLLMSGVSSKYRDMRLSHPNICRYLGMRCPTLCGCCAMK